MMKPARANGTGSRFAKSSPATCSQENSETLPQFQADFLAARFRLDNVRARLTAELLWGAR